MEETPGGTPEITGTALATETPAVETETPTTTPSAPAETPTLEPTATGTPDGTGTPAVTLTPVPSTTPTVSVSPSPTGTLTSTPGVTTTPTVSPTATATPGEPVTPTLGLASSSSLVAPGETFTLTWQIDGWSGGLAGAEGLFALPLGFTPLRPQDGEFDPAAGTFRLPLAALNGSVGFTVGPDPAWPFTIAAHLLRDGQAVAATAAFLEGHWPVEIGAEGGQVRAFGGRVNVAFPAEALPEPLSVDVRSPDPAFVAERALGGFPLEVRAFAQDDGQPVRQFLAPLTFTIAYDPARVRGDEGFLKLHYYDEAQQAWLPLRSQVDLAHHVLTGYSDHLTILDLEAQDWEAARLPSLKEFQVSSFTGASSYAFPIQVPPGPGGLQPGVSLSYSSAAVDGASGDTQAAWVGMGWALDVGSIERNMNGSMRFLEDDTFTIATNGVSGLMLETADTDGNPHTVEYHTADESFWRVQYNDQTDVWTAWDKTGNVYYFGEGAGAETKARYPWYDTAECGTASHGYKGQVTYKWMLSRMVNVHGQAITYTYAKESKNVEGVCGDDPSTHDVATAIYPYEIRYSNNHYRVRFETSDDRLDRQTSWPSSNKLIFFMKSRLRAIWVEHNPDGDSGFAGSELVRKYVLGYSKDSGSGHIFPNYTWQAGDKTLTLLQIQEYGWNGTSALPAVTFGYTGGLHLTWADNGYRGKAEYAYEAWNEVDADQSRRLKQEFRSEAGYYCSAGDTGGWGGYGSGSASCSGDHRLRVVTAARKFYSTPLLHPGGRYLLYAEIMAVTGSTAQLGLEDGSTATYGPATWVSNAAFTAISTILTLPASSTYVEGGTRAKLLIACQECKVSKYEMKWLPTYYRVTARTLRDTRSNEARTTSYVYDGGATNDAAHSADVAGTTDWDRYYQEYTEFRGHSMVQEIGPRSTPTVNDSLVTTTFYHQGDDKKGRSSVTLSGTQEFWEPFEDPNASNWTFSGLGSTQKALAQQGDQALWTYNSAANWNVNLHRAAEPIANGEMVLVQFLVSGANTVTQLALQKGAFGTDMIRWGIYVYANNSVTAHMIHIGTESDAATLIPAGQFKRDTWYVLLLGADGDKFYVRLWERENPNAASQYQRTIGAITSMSFYQWTWNGTVWLDAYSEGKLYSLHETQYDLDSDEPVPANASMLPKIEGSDPVQRYDELEIVWVRPLLETALTFDGDAEFSGTQRETQYQTSDQGGTQYGNPTRVYESEWTGSAFRRYRWRVSGYYPTVNTTKYLTGLPGYTNQYQCPGGTCDWDAANLLASAWSLYDGATSYTTPPTSGKLTGERSLLRWAGGGYTDPRYADRQYAYDSWGNRTTTTLYTTEGTGSTLAWQMGSPGAQAATVTFETTYHTYATQETNALSQSTFTGYGNNLCTTYPDVVSNGYRLGVPTSVTDANNATTHACYDVFGRMTKIVKPGDSAASPTIQISYNDAAAPFWTQVQQKLETSKFFTLRKFYNGLGQVIQVQTAGAVLADNACLIDPNSDPDPCDVIIDTMYDGKGQAWKQTAPYALSTGSGYRTPAWQYVTTTTYDALGRVLVVTAPDATTTTYSYPASPINHPNVSYDDNYSLYRETRQRDARGNTTRLLTDVWGRTVQVVPLNGDADNSPIAPWVIYTFDASDRLTQVVRGSATTNLSYDLAGRKTYLDDPDLGDWYYTYDALGNLTRQRDARNQRICFYFDPLNRLKGKNYRSDDNCPADPGYSNYTTAYYYDEGGAAAYEIGRRTRMTDASGSTTWDYDSRGRLTRETKTITGSGTFVTQWGGYNSADQPGWMKYPQDNLGGLNGEQVNFTYLAQKALDSVSGSSTYVQRSDYNAAGQVDLRRLGSGVLEQDYVYYPWDATYGQGNSQGRLWAIITPGLQELHYAYDRAGNVTSNVNYYPGGSQTQTYTYDALQRLSTAAAGGTLGLDGAYSQETYTYDSQGRLNGLPGMGTYGYNDSAHKHAVTHLGGVQKYWYDANGNMTTRVVGANTFTLGYDAENRLTTVSGAATNTYVYDGDGRRVKETSYENLALGASSTGSSTLYWPDVIADGDTYPDSGGSTSGEYAYSASTGLQYALLDLGQVYTVDKLKVWHYFIDGRTYHNTKTQVSADGVSWYTVFDSAVSGEYVETAAGRTYTFTARSVRYVRDYLNGSTANTGNHWVELEAYGSRTTAHIGNYYEWTGSTDAQVKYYYAGAARVAMRVGAGTGATGLKWLLGDHLGSTAITADGATGAKLSELRYKPWGELRYAWNTTPTGYRYTGQRAEGIGLYDYQARWYDPQLGRFSSPDTLIPGTANVQAFDRYAYTYNNPVRYNDPTGHMSDDGCRTEGCSTKPSRYNPKLSQLLTKATTTADTVSMVVSSGEQMASDMILGVMALGCLGGPELCAATMSTGFQADVYISSGLGIVENTLGLISFATTAVTDYIEGYTTSSPGEGLFIGRDTIVAARNAGLGFIPESNIDAIVSNSQLEYDLARNAGNLPGGSIKLSNSKELISQVLWQNSPFQYVWNKVTNWWSSVWK